MVHSISDNIESEDDRVEFLTSISTALHTRAKIKLNAKRLYAANGNAVRELLKVAQTLYAASRVDTEPAAEEESELAPLATRLKDIKGARALASEITDRGARLYDLLGKEKDVKAERTRALRFLDAISSNLENTQEVQHIEKSIQVLISGVKETIDSMTKHCEELAHDEKNLRNRINKKQGELERNEKRLKSLQTVRPAFMDEYEKLEVDLQRYYDMYLERFRNLDFLEHELDLYNKQEKEKLEENDRSLKRMQKRLREEELRILRGDGDGGKDAEDGDAGGDFGGGGAGGASAPRAGKGGASGGAGRSGAKRRDDDGDKVQGTMAGDDDESDSDDISDDDISHDSDSEDSDAVSLAASSMSDDGDEIEDDEEDSEIDGEGSGSYQSGESDENF